MRDAGNAAFNRTSMESKLSPLERVPVQVCLLIEPVWNRNKVCQGKMILFFLSTFNRTSMESKQNGLLSHYQQINLLIEPVWNRNPVDRPIPPEREVDF